MKFSATPDKGLIVADALSVIVGVSDARLVPAGITTVTAAVVVSITELPT